MKKYQLIALASALFALAPVAYASPGQTCVLNSTCNGPNEYCSWGAGGLCLPNPAPSPAATTPAPSSAAPSSPVVTKPPLPSSPVVTNPNLNPSGSNVTLINPLGPGIATVPALINAILKFVVYIGSFIVIFMLIYVGFLFVAAQGKEAELTKAKQALLWTIIGALILLGAQAIALGIEATVRALGTGN